MCLDCSTEQSKLKSRPFELFDLLCGQIDEKGGVLAVGLSRRFRTLHDGRHKLLDLVEWGRTKVDADGASRSELSRRRRACGGKGGVRRRCNA